MKETGESEKLINTRRRIYEVLNKEPYAMATEALHRKIENDDTYSRRPFYALIEKMVSDGVLDRYQEGKSKIIFLVQNRDKVGFGKGKDDFQRSYVLAKSKDLINELVAGRELDMKNVTNRCKLLYSLVEALENNGGIERIERPWGDKELDRDIIEVRYGPIGFDGGTYRPTIQEYLVFFFNVVGQLERSGKPR